MDLRASEAFSFQATLDCHYLVSRPEELTGRSLLIVTLHGFSSNPEVMLGLTRNLVGSAHAVVSMQAPSAFYLGMHSQDLGYSWANHKHAASWVRLHHDMVRHVLHATGESLGIPRERRVLCGFSQPVGLNYRFAATEPDEVSGVIGICGGVPKNWETGEYKDVNAALLHIARRDDEFYPEAVTAQYESRLRKRARDVEFHQLEGGHRIPSKAGPILAGWFQRVFGV